MNGPLEDIVVLDLTRLLPGPFATMIMADYGAEVIKVEPPGEGDYLRHTPPMLEENMSALYASLNRNKRHISIDLKRKEGRDIFENLLERADVLIEGFRPGVTSRLDIDYEGLKDRHPDLIYCSLTGYGQTGPWAKKAGHDINYLALAGVLGLQGAAHGPPQLSSVQIADIGGGALCAVIAISFALINCQRGGSGQYIDVAMLDGSFPWLTFYLSQYFATSDLPQRGRESLNGGLANYGIYETKDGKFLALGALEPKFWMRFCEVMEDPQLFEHNFLTPEGSKNLRSRLETLFGEKSREEWLEIFGEEDICLEPVLNIEEVLDHPQVKARELIEEMDLGGGKTFPVPAPFLNLSQTPGSIRSAPQQLGEETDQVLGEIGFSQEEIESFRQAGVIE